MFILQPKGTKFSPKHRRTLQTLVISENSPGTILHDFNVLLDCIKQGSLSVTPSRQLPMHILAKINEQLAHPIQFGLKRPQQKSYPHIQGLYLLARASGLTTIGGDKAKPVLSIDQEIYQQWTNLNASERYCGLLEIWFLKARQEILGGNDGFGLIPRNFIDTALFFSEIPSTGMSISGKRETGDWWTYSPGSHNLGLLDLFGFISVQSGTPVLGQGWQIERIERTPLGDAVLALLSTELFGHISKVVQLDDGGNTPFGILQPVLQPYFPEWRNNLSPHEWSFREGTYTFKVSLGAIWRRIAVDGVHSLDELAMSILYSVKFDDDHLYEFSYQTQLGFAQTISHPYVEESPDTSETQIGNLPLEIGQTMTFLFDFGDQWEFDVTLEQVDTQKHVKKARILEKHGDSPEQYPFIDE